MAERSILERLPAVPAEYSESAVYTVAGVVQIIIGRVGAEERYIVSYGRASKRVEEAYLEVLAAIERGEIPVFDPELGFKAVVDRAARRRGLEKPEYDTLVYLLEAERLWGYELRPLIDDDTVTKILVESGRDGYRVMVEREKRYTTNVMLSPERMRLLAKRIRLVGRRISPNSWELPGGVVAVLGAGDPPLHAAIIKPAGRPRVEEDAAVLDYLGFAVREGHHIVIIGPWAFSYLPVVCGLVPGDDSVTVFSPLAVECRGLVHSYREADQLAVIVEAPRHVVLYPYHRDVALAALSVGAQLIIADPSRGLDAVRDILASWPGATAIIVEPDAAGVVKMWEASGSLEARILVASRRPDGVVEKHFDASKIYPKGV